MLTVYGKRTSRTFRVLWMLEELGLPYSRAPVAPRSEEIRALNASGKVPALTDGEHVIHDSAAICQYLADKTGRLTFPAGTPQRGRQDALLHQVNDEFDALLWAAARHSFVLPEAQRVPEVKPSLKWEFERNQRHLAPIFKAGPYLMGERMTVPDIILAHCGRWARGAKFPVSDEFADYIDRLESRPACVRVSEMD